MTVRRTIFTLLATAFLAVPGSAAAQSNPTVDVYAQQGERVENQITPPGQVEAQVVSSTPKQQAQVQAETAPTAAAQPAQEASEGKLPFTGLDARLLLLAGVVLAGIGFATRRLASRVD